MSTIKMNQFGGMLPAWDSSLLPAGQAADSANGYLFSGALTGWRLPKLLRALTNSAAKFAYRVPTITSAVASDTLTFLSNPLAGDTIKIGETVYTFVAAIANPFDVLLGADVNASAVNLFAAITLGSGEGITYGTGTYENQSVDRSNPTKNVLTPGAQPTIYIQADDPGAGYNDTTVTESTAGVRMAWATPTYTGGVNATFNSAITGDSKWLEFLDEETDVMRSPVVDDKFNRYYFASPSEAPQYNTYDRIVADLPPFLLGIYPPGTAPNVSVVGGGDQSLLGLNTSSSSNNYVPGTNTVWVAPVNPTGTMILNNVQIMPASPSPTAKFVAVLYNDNAGVPGTIIAVGNIVTGCSTGIPLVSLFSTPPGLLPDTQYWIGMMTDSGVGFQLADDTASHGGLVQSNTWTNGPPGVFTGTTHTPDIQMWGAATTASILETRAYVYTYVTEYSEESPPSPPTLLTGWSNGVWTIKMFPPALDDMGVKRNIKTIRLYRTVSSTTGSTVYFWVGDIDITTNEVTTTLNTRTIDGDLVATGTLQVADTWTDAIVSLNIQMPSTNWFPPEQGIEGILAMPNGMAVGFRKNEIWFSEPYRPHAWPPGYVITTEFPIVGLGVVGMSVVACTSGTPYVATGVNPSSMSLLKLPEAAPCSSRGSILSMSDGVYYASHKGLMLVKPSGSMSNTTELWITHDKWMVLTPQKNLHTVLQNSCYFAFGIVAGDDTSEAQRGFTIELNPGDSSSFTIWPQPGGHRIGFNRMTAPREVDIDNVVNDPWTGITMLFQGGNIYYYDFMDQAPEVQPYTWTSKRYQEKAKADYSAMRVFFTVPPNTPVQNSTRNESDTNDLSWNTLDTGQYGIISVYGDDQLVTTREIRSNGELLRIASGQKCEFWQFSVKGRVEISNIQAATSVKALREQ